MKNLIIVGHPNTESFCYDGIFKTVKNELSTNKEEIEIIDLYRDSFTRPRTKLIKKYQDLVTWSERIYFISPVWWFRLTPRMEIFFDEVFAPGFAYEFVNITKLYAYPKPFLKNKKVREYKKNNKDLIKQKNGIRKYYRCKMVQNNDAKIIWMGSCTSNYWCII